MASGNRTERVAGRVNATRESAEGVVAEGFARKRRPERLRGASRTEFSLRNCIEPDPSIDE